LETFWKDLLLAVIKCNTKLKALSIKGTVAEAEESSDDKIASTIEDSEYSCRGRFASFANALVENTHLRTGGLVSMMNALKHLQVPYQG
jgi:hypothetical protein